MESTRLSTLDSGLVIKVGGGKGIRYDFLAKELKDYPRTVLVHGGSDELNRISERLGHPPRFIKSPSGFTSRYTDLETIRIFEMVYCGKQNKTIVEMLQAEGINALGLSGLDGRLLEGSRKKSIKSLENDRIKIIRDDYSGKVERVNRQLLELLLDHGYIPVITPPAISTDNEPINVDGDRAAAMIARAMGAKTLLILSNVPGLLRDVADETSRIDRIDRNRIEEVLRTFALDRMKKKILGAKEAIESGVERVILASANRENPIARALAGDSTIIA